MSFYEQLTDDQKRDLNRRAFLDSDLKQLSDMNKGYDYDVLMEITEPGNDFSAMLVMTLVYETPLHSSILREIAKDKDFAGKLATYCNLDDLEHLKWIRFDIENPDAEFFYSTVSKEPLNK